MTTRKLMTNWRWVMCAMLFFATTVNYMDRQVLSLTFKEFIQPEFHWTDSDYGTITGVFSIAYAIFCLFAGKFIDWMGTKKGYLWAIIVWSLGAVMHAGCGWVTEQIVGLESKAALLEATGTIVSTISMVSVYLFLFCRLILGLGEAGNFPAAIKVTAEYFPKKDRAFATALFNAGASVGALAAPATIPLLAKSLGWEMAFIIIGALGFLWAGVWIFVYDKPEESKHVNEAELEYIHQDETVVPDETGKTLDGKGAEEKQMSFGEAFKHKQTWSFAFGKFMTDGQAQTDLVVCVWQVHDRRRLVVLPVLGTGIFPGSVRYQGFRPAGYSFDFHAVCDRNGYLAVRRLSAEDLRREERHGAVCRPYAGNADLCVLPAHGIVCSTVGS